MADSSGLRAELPKPIVNPALQVSGLGKHVPLPTGELTILEEVG